MTTDFQRFVDSKSVQLGRSRGSVESKLRSLGVNAHNFKRLTPQMGEIVRLTMKCGITDTKVISKLIKREVGK
jgi:hypothetical protein